MLESSDDIDHSNEDVADVELKVRIRRYTEETASLKDELLRAEEAISTLERDIKLTAKNLYVFQSKFSHFIYYRKLFRRRLLVFNDFHIRFTFWHSNLNN